jgi:hypothetical protein
MNALEKELQELESKQPWTTPDLTTYGDVKEMTRGTAEAVAGDAASRGIALLGDSA